MDARIADDIALLPIGQAVVVTPDSECTTVEGGNRMTWKKEDSIDDTSTDSEEARMDLNDDYVEKVQFATCPCRGVFISYHWRCWSLCIYWLDSSGDAREEKAKQSTESGRRKAKEDERGGSGNRLQ